MGRAPFFIPLIGLILAILVCEYWLDYPLWGGKGTLPVTGSGYYSAEVIHVQETNGNALMGIVKVDSVNRNPIAPFNISVQLIGHRNVVAPGERIAFRSSITEPKPKQELPDIVSENPLDRRYRVVGFSMVLPDSLIYVVDGNSLSARMYRLNQRMQSRLSRAELDDRTFMLLSAMLLGDKSMLTPEETDAYSASGLSHLLALSGTHVAVIVSLISLALFPLTVARRNRTRFVLSILLLWFYALLTGMSPSVVRAAVMATVYLVGRILERPSVPINSLCFAAWIILMFEPQELFMPGFQMSFAAVAGIIVFYPLLNQIDRRKHPWLYLLWSYPAVSISAMLLTGIVAGWYFHTFPLYFLPANLLAVPLMPLMLGLGIVLLIAPEFYPASWAVNELSSLLDSLAGWISGLPLSVVGDVYLPLWLTILLPILLLLAGLSLHFRKYSLSIACGIVFLTSCVAAWITRPQFSMKESFELDGAIVERDGERLRVYTEIRNEADRRNATIYYTRKLRHYCARRNLSEPEIMPLP